MLPPAAFIHAQIVDIEGADVRENIVVQVLLEDAEGIAQHFALFIHSGENGTGIVGNKGQQLFVGIFLSTGLKKVWPAHMVHHQNLLQKPVQPGQVGGSCSSDDHEKHFLLQFGLFLIIPQKTFPVKRELSFREKDAMIGARK